MTYAVNLAQSGSNNTTFRNKIINGGMVIDQRNAGASVTPTTNTYMVDRWITYISQSSKFSFQQNAGSITSPTGFSNYLGFTSLSSYTVGSAERFVVVQPIEGFNTADLAWGTANAKTVTFSFQVYSSLTGTFGGSIQNNGTNRSYPFSYTISSANTWTPISVTIAGDTTGTWLTNNSVGMYVAFSLGAGSTLSGTAGAWASGNYWSATGATSVVGTSGATFYITGVQLEAGSAASPFENRLYGTELSLCQRYYEVYNLFYNAESHPGMCESSTIAYSSWKFVATKRAAPTCNSFGTITCVNATGAGVTPSSLTFPNTNIDIARFQLNVSSGLVAGNATLFYTSTSTGGGLTASAEL